MDREKADELLIRIDERTDQIKTAVDKLDQKFNTQVIACRGFYVSKDEFTDVQDAYKTARRATIGAVITAVLALVGILFANGYINGG